MSFAPQQNWSLYAARARAGDAEWIRSLSPSQKCELYAELFDIVWAARSCPGNWEELDQWHWQQKHALRNKMVEAYRKMDQIESERIAANHSS